MSLITRSLRAGVSAYLRISSQASRSVCSSHFVKESLTAGRSAKHEEISNPLQEEATVYVHWPFCKKLCTFCNFNKYVRHDVDHDRMRDCLVQELTTLLRRSGVKKIKSVYFGGGTPSLAKPSTLFAILDCVTNVCQMDDGAEVSLEANPSSSETLSLRDFRTAGVNRLSLGVQSLCSKDLTLLRRDHTIEESLRSLEEAKTLFPGKVSIDLLFGRPGQTVSAWEKELNKVLPLCDTHLSLYQLTLEKGTPLYNSVKHGQVSLPGPDTMADLYQQAVEVLEQAGYQRYEVSSFSKPGHESLHNLSYWTGVPYIGIGPGAHSRYFLECSGKLTRFACKLLNQMLGCLRLEELLMSSLRTMQGLTNQIWSKLSPVGFSNLVNVYSMCHEVEDFIDAGLLMMDEVGIRASPSGLNVIDGITTPLALHLEKYVSQFTG